MPTLDFGQPERGIIQMAYVAADIRAAMTKWTRDLNVGPDEMDQVSSRFYTASLGRDGSHPVRPFA